MSLAAVSRRASKIQNKRWIELPTTPTKNMGQTEVTPFFSRKQSYPEFETGLEMTEHDWRGQNRIFQKEFESYRIIHKNFLYLQTGMEVKKSNYYDWKRTWEHIDFSRKVAGCFIIINGFIFWLDWMIKEDDGFKVYIEKFEENFTRDY